MIPKGTIKLAMMMGEHSRTSMVMTEFLMIDCPSTSNVVIGKSLLKALKALTSIYCLTIKFPTAMGTGQVREGNATRENAIIGHLSKLKKKENYLK